VRGGKNSSRRARLEKLMPEPLRPVFALLEKALTDVSEGRLTPQQGSAMASLTGAMVRILKAGEQAGPDLAPQLTFPGIEAWYEEIRAFRRTTPPLKGKPLPDEDDEDRDLDAWLNEHGTIILPEETM